MRATDTCARVIDSRSTVRVENLGLAQNSIQPQVLKPCAGAGYGCTVYSYM
jgi:hypothetical protein